MADNFNVFSAQQISANTQTVCSVQQSVLVAKSPAAVFDTKKQEIKFRQEGLERQDWRGRRDVTFKR